MMPDDTLAEREKDLFDADMWKIQQQILMEIAQGCETDFPLSQGPKADQWKE